MARISMEEFQQIKAAYLHPYMGRFNDLWDKRMLQLFDTIEAQQQELEKLKELTENLKELTTRHIFHKMTPSTCSIPIQVFENREEWLEFARVNFAITKLLGESEVGEDDCKM